MVAQYVAGSAPDLHMQHSASEGTLTLTLPLLSRPPATVEDLMRLLHSLDPSSSIAAPRWRSASATSWGSISLPCCA